MKLMIVGDTHMDDFVFHHIHAVAKYNNVDKIVQLGDFGFVFSPDFIDTVSDEIPVYWIDGNHDNHDFINYKMENSNPTQDGFYEFWENVFYIPRGLVWSWQGKNFLGMGGAYSIDQAARTKYVSYWPDETISEMDLIRALDNSQGIEIDYMLSHDMPYGTHIEDIMKENPLGGKLDDHSRNNRKKLTLILKKRTVHHVYHGHMHHRYDARIGETLVTGLAAADLNFLAAYKIVEI